jgi:hypothetical protein
LSVVPELPSKMSMTKVSYIESLIAMRTSSYQSFTMEVDTVVSTTDTTKLIRFLGLVVPDGSRRFGSHRTKDENLFKFVIGGLSQMGLRNEADNLSNIVSYSANKLYYLVSNNEHNNIPYVDGSIIVYMKTMFGLTQYNGYYNMMGSTRQVDKTFATFKTLHLQRLQGWVLDEEDYTEEQQLWVNNRARLMNNSMLNNKATKITQRISNIDYILDRKRWATAGSTDNKDRIIKGLPKTKMGLALSMTDTMLKDLYFGKLQPNCPVIEKKEPGYPRDVILVPVQLHLWESYVLFYFEQLTRKTRSLYNYMSKEGKAQTWLDINDSVTMGAEPITLDGKGWDESIMTSDIDTFYTTLQSILAIYGVDISYEVTRIIEFNHNCYIDISSVLDEQGIIDANLQLGSTLLKVKKGLLSGRRSTTAVNSVTNDSRLKLLFDSDIVLGDDSIILCRPNDKTVRTLNDIADFFKVIGFNINVNKSRWGKGWDFLKMHLDKRGIPTGDLVRSMKSIFFSSKDERDDTSVVAKMNTRVDIWVKCISRGLEINDLLVSNVCEDLFQACNRVLPKDNIKLSLFTPKCFGGLGMFPTNSIDGLGFSVVTESKNKNLNITNTARYRTGKLGIVAPVRNIFNALVGQKFPTSIVTTNTKVLRYNMVKFNRYSAFTRVRGKSWVPVFPTFNKSVTDSTGLSTYSEFVEAVNALDPNHTPAFSEIRSSLAYIKNRVSARLRDEYCTTGISIPTPVSWFYKYGEIMSSLLWSNFQTNIISSIAQTKLTVNNVLGARLWAEVSSANEINITPYY